MVEEEGKQHAMPREATELRLLSSNNQCQQPSPEAMWMGNSGNKGMQKPSERMVNWGSSPYLAISLRLKIAILLRKAWFESEIMGIIWHHYGIPSHRVGRH